MTCKTSTMAGTGSGAISGTVVARFDWGLERGPVVPDCNDGMGSSRGAAGYVSVTVRREQPDPVRTRRAEGTSQRGHPMQLHLENAEAGQFLRQRRRRPFGLLPGSNGRRPSNRTHRAVAQALTACPGCSGPAARRPSGRGASLARASSERVYRGDGGATVEKPSISWVILDSRWKISPAALIAFRTFKRSVSPRLACCSK